MTDNNSGNSPPFDAHLRVPERVLMRHVGDELVLLNLDQESYYGLNPVGARLMQLAETGATLEAITARLLTEFDVSRERLEIDVRAVAAQLIATGLLEQGIAG